MAVGNKISHVTWLLFKSFGLLFGLYFVVKTVKRKKHYIKLYLILLTKGLYLYSYFSLKLHPAKTWLLSVHFPPSKYRISTVTDTYW